MKLQHFKIAHSPFLALPFVPFTGAPGGSLGCAGGGGGGGGRGLACWLAALDAAALDFSAAAVAASEPTDERVTEDLELLRAKLSLGG
jgi:hypothetical protein